MTLLDSLRGWIRCKRGDHDPETWVYRGIPMGGAYDYGREYFDGPYIKMKRVKCRRCHDVLSVEPTTDEPDDGVTA